MLARRARDDVESVLLLDVGAWYVTATYANIDELDGKPSMLSTNATATALVCDEDRFADVGAVGGHVTTALVYDITKSDEAKGADYVALWRAVESGKKVVARSREREHIRVDVRGGVIRALWLDEPRLNSAATATLTAVTHVIKQALRVDNEGARAVVNRLVVTGGGRMLPDLVATAHAAAGYDVPDTAPHGTVAGLAAPRGAAVDDDVGPVTLGAVAHASDLSQCADVWSRPIPVLLQVLPADLVLTGVAGAIGETLTVARAGARIPLAETVTLCTSADAQTEAVVVLAEALRRGERKGVVACLPVAVALLGVFKSAPAGAVRVTVSVRVDAGGRMAIDCDATIAAGSVGDPRVTVASARIADAAAVSLIAADTAARAARRRGECRLRSMVLTRRRARSPSS